ncbi:hypothetical protein LTR56_019920 [Elasticomyces elasticus]|nr:hypothetical protein LTR56_019920 [Elasticomyces elasticus]KAK3643393.1 hypothetical protein LTR22_015696 [Elasticomyces elasticus]KAK4914021.1 hypothetical protein LTR49_017735 [Elasticomyces elasticus]KAK5755468.1 hypothetical protein LTS12_014453 [Elasticomyces elasticus]
MAGKKRPKSAPSQTAMASESPTAPRASPPARKRRRSTKGYTETKEIDSDEENKPKPPSRGVLAGLDPNATDLSQRRPRGEQKPNYNMKFHPSLDPYIKPATAAKYNAGLPTQSSPVKYMTDGETSEETEPTLAGDSDNDQSGADNDDVPVLIKRGPDPKASRHSTRTEAQKPVNYSRKYHPNDLDLPGFKAKAEAAIKSGEFVAPKRPQKRKSGGDGTSKGVPADDATDKRSTSGNEEEEDGRGSDDDQGAEGDEGHQDGVHEDEGDIDPSDDEQPRTARKADGPPRKKLKTTSSGSPSAVKARKKPQPRKKQSKKAVELGSEAEMNSTEFADYMEKIGQGSQSRPIDIPDDHVDEEQESEEEDDGLDNAVIPSRQVDPAATPSRSARSSSKRQTSQEPKTKNPTARIDSETESDEVAATPTPRPSSGHRIPQSDRQAAPTHMRSEKLHVRTPDNGQPPSNGPGESDASAAATMKNNMLASQQSRSTAAPPSQAEGEHVYRTTPHDNDESLDVDHDQLPSHFADAFANTEHAHGYLELDGPADDIEAAETVAKSIPDSDGSSSSSSCIVPRMSQENQEEDSDNAESRNAPLSSATKVTQAKKASAVKTHGIVNMTPVTQPGNKHLTSSRTLSDETVKQNAKTSSTARAGSTVTSSPAEDVQQSYEMMWQASGKPGISYNSD